MNSEGASIEIGMVGYEGMVGVPSILGTSCRIAKLFRWAEMRCVFGGYEHSDTKNRIIKALPLKEYRLVMAQLKPVELAQEVVLYDAGERIRDVYFPEEATVSDLSGTADGETFEVCVIGNEGVVGLASLLAETTAFRAVVQLPGLAYKLSRDLLRNESNATKRCIESCFIMRMLF